MTVDDLVADIDTPRTTAYSRVGTLVDLGGVNRDENEKADIYAAAPITLTANLNGNTFFNQRSGCRPPGAPEGNSRHVGGLFLE
ncbi:hypothetical protein [Halomicrococcus sp. NG-SE-24]|uniref:hypothetical protein n=1 Tax=Halomicrococcus sp. NG-SE-24 TaxID=3436928 RepID=UPI003D96FABD